MNLKLSLLLPLFDVSYYFSLKIVFNSELVEAEERLKSEISDLNEELQNIQKEVEEKKKELQKKKKEKESQQRDYEDRKELLDDVTERIESIQVYFSLFFLLKPFVLPGFFSYFALSLLFSSKFKK